MRNRAFALLSLFIALTGSCPALADGQTTTTGGISVVFLHGQHSEQNGATSAPLIPAPVLMLSHRARRIEIVVEGIPPLRSYPVGNNALGIQNIGLSYFEGTLRYWNPSNTFAAGIGETLYNQRTDYLLFASPNVDAGQYDASRVAGARYEAIERLRLRGAGNLEISLAANPSLHGRVHWTEYESGIFGSSTVDLAPASEVGSQVEAAVAVEHPAGRYRLIYGLRYLNYVAHFDGGAFADRNAFVMPFVGVTRLLGF